MKINLYLFMISGILIFAGLTGCSKKNSTEIVIDEKQAVSFEKSEKKDNGKIDIDLSTMNYNLISAQIFNILVESDRFLGKRVKIKGKFYSGIEEGRSERNYSVLIWDPTACCQTGLQFIPKKDLKYPEDFPEEMDDIEITGILRMKDMDGIDYLYLESENF